MFSVRLLTLEKRASNTRQTKRVRFYEASPQLRAAKRPSYSKGIHLPSGSGLGDLPDNLLLYVWSFLDLKTVSRIRAVQKKWKQKILEDVRWIPSIQPPWLPSCSLPSASGPDGHRNRLTASGPDGHRNRLTSLYSIQDRETYYKLYIAVQRWQQQRDQLLGQINTNYELCARMLSNLGSEFDGWAALGPFDAPAKDPTLFHRAMLGSALSTYGHPRRGFAFAARNGDRKGFLGTWGSGLQWEGVRRSLYFQTRRGVEARRRQRGGMMTLVHTRWIYTESLQEFLRANYFRSFYATQAIRPAIQIVTVKTNGIPELSRECEDPTISRALYLAEKIISCLLPPTGIVQLKGSQELPINIGGDKHQRWIRRTADAMQVDARVFEQRGTPVASFRERSDHATVIYVVGVNLFDSRDPEMEWCHSINLNDYEEEWLLSTYQIRRLLSPEKAFRAIASLVTYSALFAASGITPCENYPCIMNNCSAITQLAEATMVPCVGCLRKLEAIGAMPNVKTSLTKLLKVYSSCSKGMFATECDILRCWLAD